MTAGRVEARITVPTGGYAASASNGASSSAATATVPAGFYYHTSVAGYSALLTELQTQLQSSRPPTGQSWVVTKSASGLVSIGLSGVPADQPSFSLVWTSTTLRDLLGFTSDLNYPTTAALMNTACGYGTWASGFLFNEASGNLSQAFGTAYTLTANGTPVYSNLGPRGGTDKAVAMDAAADGFSEDTNALGDVDGSSDLLMIAVVKTVDVTGSATQLLSKYDFLGGAGYTTRIETNETLSFDVRDGTDTASATCAAMPTGTWCALAFALDRATDRIRCGYVRLDTQAVTVGTEVDVSTIDSMTNGRAFRVCRTGTNGGEVQVAALYIATGAGAAAGASSSLSTLLTNFGATFGTWTATKQARGLWFPDCPLDLDGDPERAPTVSDLMTSMGPTGIVFGHVGNTYRQHTSLRWSHVPLANTWEEEATYDNGSWETFFNDTQLGLGPSCFSPATPIQIYDHAGIRLGADVTITGWQIVGVTSIEPRKAVHGWTGLWTIELPRLVAAV